MEECEGAAVEAAEGRTAGVGEEDVAVKVQNTEEEPAGKVGGIKIGRGEGVTW